jgi:branched-chain amino acid transport system permease protein
MQLALTILVDGLSYASWLFIVALGLTLVFGVLKILNIAHGSFYALGAYATASAVAWVNGTGLPPYLVIAGHVVGRGGLAAGRAVDRAWLAALFYGRDEVLLVLVTYAMFLMLEDITKLIWGANPYYVSEPYACSATSTSATKAMWVTTCCSGLAWRCSWVPGLVGLEPHPHGKNCDRRDPQPEVASSMGVNVSRVYMGAFARASFWRPWRRLHRAHDFCATRACRSGSSSFPLPWSSLVGWAA